MKERQRECKGKKEGGRNGERYGQSETADRQTVFIRKTFFFF